MSPAGIDALIVAGQGDHATGMRRVALHGCRYRLELGSFAHARVEHHAEVVVFTHLALITQAALSLIDSLAGVIKRDVADHLTWIVTPLCLG